MTAQELDQGSIKTAGQQVAERDARFLPGLRMLVLGIVVLAAGVALLWLASRFTGAAATTLIWLGALVLLTGALLVRGLTAIVPGRSHVIQLFGKYRGTIREPGLQWVNPFTNRIVVSTRIRNQESAQLKVNDADGNPIEIAAVVVWLVRDTAHAIYAVDDYRHFVTVQTETAVRHIASSYPYDSRGTGALSLRDNADEITERLSAELTARVMAAGVQIIETRLTRLSYAPGSASSRGPSAWSASRLSGSKKRASSSWTRSARPPWSRTSWLCCAASRPPSRSSTPARSTSDDPHRSAMTERKGVLLRLDPAVHDALARWASDELRSTNAQIEFLLRRALAEAGRLPSAARQMRGPGRPRRDPTAG